MKKELTQKSKVYDFAFLVHPRAVSDIHNKYRLTKLIPSFFLEYIFKYFPPIQVARIEGLIDEQGKKRTGVIISISMTAKQMLKDRNAAKKQVVLAMEKARRMGVSHIGLGAFTSVVTQGGAEVKDAVPHTHVTNGNALTAYVAYQDIKRIAKEHPKNTLTISIIGATGSVGSAVAKLLANEHVFKTLYIVGKTPSKIEVLMEHLQQLTEKTKVYSASVESSLPDADIILTATSANGAVLDKKLIKKNAIIYDITQPKNIPDNIFSHRPDVIVYDGGLIQLPKSVKIRPSLGISVGTAFSCLAETMLLSLAKYPDDFCIGAVSLDHVAYIQTQAEKYIFTQTNKLQQLSK